MDGVGKNLSVPAVGPHHALLLLLPPPPAFITFLASRESARPRLNRDEEAFIKLQAVFFLPRVLILYLRDQLLFCFLPLGYDKSSVMEEEVRGIGWMGNQFIHSRFFMVLWLARVCLAGRKMEGRKLAPFWEKLISIQGCPACLKRARYSNRRNNTFLCIHS